MKELIQRLVEMYGPSGREDPVRRAVEDEVRPLADAIHVTPLGSLHATVNRGGGARLMLSAHLDEIGIIISHIDERGFALFAPVGPVALAACVGQQVRFMNEAVAIICAETRADRSRPPAFDRLYLDFGLGSAELCPVRVGDMAVFDRPLVQVGRRLIGKALDDRLGLAILIETLRRVRKTPHELQFAFTAQAEFGAAGSLTSAYSLDPEVSLSVDLADAEDGPQAGSSSISLGKGPAVRTRDGEDTSDPQLVEWLVRRAGAARIPHQYEVAEGATCGALHVLRVRTGVRAAGISIPCRYRHTPSEMADLGDLEAAVRWLLEIARRPIDLA